MPHPSTPIAPLGREAPLFWGGCLAFAALAVLGWLKLPYGVSWADEGMYVADAWRLAAGDRMFPDAETGVLRLYAVFNGWLFSLFPDISLLAIRRIQFGLALGAAGLLGFAVWRHTGRRWALPWALAPFAFLGLDPVGKTATLSYYHYPHLFLIGHVALLLLALDAAGGARRALLFASGCCLWGIGFALLPLSVSAAAPALLWLVLRRLAPGSFTLGDLPWVLAPVALLWGIVFAAYGAPFWSALADMLRYAQQGGKTQAHLDREGIQYVAVMAAAAAAAWGALRLPARARLAALAALAGGVWWGMATGFGGAIAPYWRGWFAAPMWFCGLLMAALGVYALALLPRLARPRPLNRDGRAILVLMLPAGVLAAVFAYFSEIGFLTTAYAAMPAWLGIVLIAQHAMRGRGMGRAARALALVALVLPFTWQLCRADWRFTLFDLPPKYLTQTVPDGFLRGIRTNPLFLDLDRWLRDRAARFSTPDELAIVLERAPMAHLSMGRRPALNHAWLGLMRSALLRYEAVERMQQAGREPAVAVRFLQPPLFFPVDLDNGVSAPAPPATFYPDHSVSNYVTQNMVRVDVFRPGGWPWAEFYVSPAALARYRAQNPR
ncbi:MAG: hypothetical protein HZA24_02310 [Nitrospirae bacterium]|nr:hypothetical protein [Nitrospirota bacterium]